MTGQENLYVIALIISLFTILGVTISFTSLFFLFSFHKRRCINNGLDDAQILKEFYEPYNKYNNKKEKKGQEKITVKQYYEKEKHKDKVIHLIADVFTGIVIFFFLAIFCVGLSFRLTDNQVYLFGHTYLTILSNSMEKANSTNTYIKENKLENQIQQYSLISIKKVEKQDDIKLYDVIAFRVKAQDLGDDYSYYTNSYSITSNTGPSSSTAEQYVILVHRVISIYDGKDDDSEATLNGVTYFTTRGDTNNASLDVELAITFDNIVGVYDGYNSFILGVFIIYFKSEIGIICLIAASIFLFLAVWSEELITRDYDRRLLKLLNIGPDLAIDNNEENKSKEVVIEEKPIEEEFINEEKEEVVEIDKSSLSLYDKFKLIVHEELNKNNNVTNSKEERNDQIKIEDKQISSSEAKAETKQEVKKESPPVSIDNDSSLIKKFKKLFKDEHSKVKKK